MPFPQTFWDLISPNGNYCKVKSDENLTKYFINLANPIGHIKPEHSGDFVENQPKLTAEGAPADSFIMSQAKMNGTERRKLGAATEPEPRKSEPKGDRKAVARDEIVRGQDDRDGKTQCLTLLESIVRKMKCITDSIEHGRDDDSGCAKGSGDNVADPSEQRHTDEEMGRIEYSGDTVKEISKQVEEKISEDSIQEYVPVGVEIPKVTSEAEESEIELPDVESIGLSATSDEFDGIDLPDQDVLRSASLESIESFSKYALDVKEIDFEKYDY
ncbi:uncharacterized protein LOC124166652 [Ischnura elegans]|uniref:uncharacterized protein LOC124166652 n=1 Tax=Ischnura elegans TaxID=197161 RepID=UPI001ED8AB06|nr:uncharacterized protein LOC124166652 [Ischnura elegans]